MGLLSKLLSAGIKTIVLPVAMVKDVVDTVNGDSGRTKTGKLIDSTLQDLGDAMDDACDIDLF